MFLPSDRLFKLVIFLVARFEMPKKKENHNLFMNFKKKWITCFTLFILQLSINCELPLRFTAKFNMATNWFCLLLQHYDNCTCIFSVVGGTGINVDKFACMLRMCAIMYDCFVARELDCRSYWWEFLYVV